MEEKLKLPSYEKKQGLFSWWFNPKNRYSIIKIPTGLMLGLFIISSFINDSSMMINAFRNEPLFTGMIIFIIFPLLATFFTGVILWGGLFYLPYYVLEEEKDSWKYLLILIISLVIICIIAGLINFFVFGWTYL